MSIESSYGFRSAQAAWENKNPFDGECTCLDDDLFICPDCGYCDGTTEMDCPDCDGVVQKASDQMRIEEYPSASCQKHSDYTDEDAADDARERDYESRAGL